MKKLVIRMPNWLGDCVMATAFIHPLKEHYGEIYAAVPAGLERVFEGNGGITEVVSYDRKKLNSTLKAAKKISALKPDCAVSLTPSLSAHLFLFLCGAAERYGYADDGGSFFLTKAYSRDRAHRREHVTSEYEKIFSLAAGTQVRRGGQFLGLPEGFDSIGNTARLRLSNPMKKAFIAPFTKGGRAKAWPAERYGEVVKTMLKNGVAVYLTGLESDRLHIFDKEILMNEFFFDMRGAPLPEVFFTLSKMNVFLGNDSGLMHAADALGVPAVVVFGATAPGWGGPFQTRTAVLYKGIDCQPCYENECRYGHYRCIKDVDVAEVLEKLAGQMS